jgi:shikimate kinase
MAKKDNLILIGMPASGKSTVGIILAKVMGYDFIDSDLLIQKKEGMRLSEIIAKKGIDGFIAVENEVNASIEASRSVIATGGSAIYGEEAMAHLREIGAIIYLQVDFKVIQKRLHNIRQRGVVLREGQTLHDLYEERCALYEKYADLIVREGKGEIEAVVARIVRTLRAGSQNAQESSCRRGEYEN